MKNIKVLSLALISAVSWIADWFLLQQAIYAGKPPYYWIWPTILTIFAISILMFFYLINRNRWISLAVQVIIVTAYVLLMPKDAYVILGGGIFFMLMFLFEQRLRSEEKNAMHFSIRRITANTISVMIYALLLLLGFNIYYNTQADFQANPDLYYQRLGQSAARSVPFFTRELPAGVDFNQTVDEFLSSQAHSSNPSIIQHYRDQFFGQFQIKATPGSETLGDVFGQVAADKIKQASANYQGYFPFIFAIVVIGLLWSFAFLLRWAIQLVNWALFKILMTFRFFKLTKVTIEVHKLDV